jgi:hypothetical protein
MPSRLWNEIHLIPQTKDAEATPGEAECTGGMGNRCRDERVRFDGYTSKSREYRKRRPALQDLKTTASICHCH